MFDLMKYILVKLCSMFVFINNFIWLMELYYGFFYWYFYSVWEIYKYDIFYVYLKKYNYIEK